MPLAYTILFLLTGSLVPILPMYPGLQVGPMSLFAYRMEVNWKQGSCLCDIADLM